MTMVLFLSVLSGIIIAVMIAQNAGLSEAFGMYHSTVIVHIVGLLCILLWMFLRKEKFRWNLTTHWPFYLGGVFGVITVVLANFTFFSLGVSLTLALQLLGQCLAGGLIDHFGWFGLPKTPFRRQHLISFSFIAIGLTLMYLF